MNFERMVGWGLLRGTLCETKPFPFDTAQQVPCNKPPRTAFSKSSLMGQAGVVSSRRKYTAPLAASTVRSLTNLPRQAARYSVLVCICD